LASSTVKAKSGVSVSVTRPGALVNAMRGARVSTVKVRLASVPSRLPARSFARTLKTKSPSAVVAAEKGEAHGTQSALPPLGATRHSNEPGESEENRKAGARSFVGPLPFGSFDGPSTMSVSGAAVSTTKSSVATGPALPRASVACTAKACGPSVRPAYAKGEAHGARVAPSSPQAKVAAGSSLEKAIVPPAWFVSAGRSTATVGPDSSTVQVRTASGPAAPSASTARTDRECGPGPTVSSSGDAHAAAAAPSSAQAKVAAGSSEANVKVALADPVTSAGPDVIVGGPGAAHAREAETASASAQRARDRRIDWRRMRSSSGSGMQVAATS
jgi:hypothetical protein